MSRQFIPLQPFLDLRIWFKKKNTSLVFPLNKQNSCYYYERNAIWDSLQMMRLKQGDEVLMPAYNSGSEAQVLSDYGIRLVYYDTTRNCRVCVKKLEEFLSSNTKALYLIHYFGFSQPIKEVQKFCKENELLLLEDCALSLFSQYNEEKHLGEYGDCSYFCFRKYLAVPHGGALVVNSSQDAIFLSKSAQSLCPSIVSTASELISLMLMGIMKKWRFTSHLYRLIRVLVRGILKGLKADSGEPDFDLSKRQWRMTRISRFLLDRFDYSGIIAQRKKNYFYFKSRLQPVIDRSYDLDFFSVTESPGFVPHCLPLLVSDNRIWSSALAQKGIQAGAWWHLDSHEFYKEHCPNNTWLRKHVLELPIHQGLIEKDVDIMVQAFEDILNDTLDERYKRKTNFKL